MRLYDFVSYEAMSFAFSDDGEQFECDVSVIHVLCILYCKDKLLDFSVDVFGAKGTDSLPLYSEILPVESREVTSVEPILPYFVTGMFDKRILQLFSRKGLSILWNPGEPSHAEIDPHFPDLTMTLLPEEH